MPQPNTTFTIAVLPGDGIGSEILPPTVALLEMLSARFGTFKFNFVERRDCGASYFRGSGEDCSKEAFETARQADAILLGAMGLPSVRWPSGTEIAPHLRMREEFQLISGVRPVKAFPNTPCRLADPRAANIDLVILRESTEGLFFTRRSHRRQ
jgi:3-isopropylmalate dehydrogenase